MSQNRKTNKRGKTKNINLKMNKIRYDQFEDTIKYMPEQDWKIFLETLRESEDRNRARNKLMIQLLLRSGTRVNEFSKIKVCDLDFTNGTIKIPWANTKTKKSRTATISAELMLDLKDYLQTNNIKTGYIFYNKKTRESLTTRNYNLIIEKYWLLCKNKLSIEFKPHAHTFRHSHIVFALQKGVPMNAVMQQVGHINLTTTQIYSKLAAKDIKESYREANF